MAVLSDPISDFLTRFKNATLARNEEFTAPHSKIKAELARILSEEGYLWGYEVVGEGVSKVIKARPKYAGKRPVLTDLRRVSRPGRRQYVGSQDIPVVMSGLGIAIISTSRGLMTGARAKKEKHGGEILALVW